MKKYILALLVLVSSMANVKAQSSVPNLQIGDTIPDVVLQKLINYPTRSAKMSDFKGKLIILDFWASWCGPCLTSLPKMQELQKQFGEKVMILPVNSKDSRGENEARARDMFQRRNIQLPSVVEDNLLRKLFRHQTVPHEVWIDKNGVVIAFTSDDEVTADNITAALNGTTANMKMKIENNIKYDSDKHYGGIDYKHTDAIYRSALFPNRPEIRGAGNCVRKTDTQRWVMLTSQTPHQIFLVAGLTWGGYNHHPDKIIWQVSDTAKYLYPKEKDLPNAYYKTFDEFLNSRYDYEFLMPAATPDSIFFDNMLMEVNKMFPLKGKVDWRMMPCWLLVRTDTTVDLLKAKGGKFTSPAGSRSLTLTNAKMGLLAWLLGHFRANDAVYDETGYEGRIDISLDYSTAKTYNYNTHAMITSFPMDFELIQQGLAKYNLKLVRSQRLQRVLTLSDLPEVYSKWKL